ncbi:Xaa-Pro dipeptidase [Spiroplasma sp. TIUS-1]|uniref:M24 family metallopeptidase n=1 Tax=Spiroplasma sp. TIUS-1 TaxID=216963 RepID=UPI0013979020|nr:aminopeptidase P family protein [Spiroplasma sp. TIUS-1]QHX35780.1 Xaa-Pro dipeptidase [Spiroplasma sp. TIUS-1]
MKKDILNNLMNDNGADAVLLHSPQNRLWFTRFSSSLGYVLFSKNKTYLLIDGRYHTMAIESKELINVDEIINMNNASKQINELIQKLNIKKMIIESDWVYVNQFDSWSKIFKAKLIKTDTSKIRMIKDQWEIDQIRKACDITNLVFEKVLKNIKIGMSELEIARFVSNQFLELGAQKLSFDTIVASGEMNGSMPHATPSNRTIKEGDFVTLDMGCYVNGYCSDQTRTFAIGETINPKLIDIYQTVLESQQKGISALKEGISSGDIHKICFDYIESKGYGEYFTHGTGHGLGIEIHEEPYNAKNQTEILRAGMTVTVEPGIYIPGLGGVRIEDDLLVTKDGFEYLTTARRELIHIKG